MTRNAQIKPTPRLLLREGDLELFKIDNPVPEDADYILSFRGTGMKIPFWRAGQFAGHLLADMLESSPEAAKAWMDNK
jgi:hypothetical protein